MNKNRWIVLLFLLLFISGTVASCRWQAPGVPVPDPRIEQPPRFIPGPDRPQSGGETDESFTTDFYTGLAQYLTKQTLHIPVDITRYFGPADADGRLADPVRIESAYLTLRAWDIDSQYTGTDLAPEVLRVRINGHPLTPLVSGVSGQWTTFTLPVPPAALRFPAGHSPVVAARNWIEIDLDADNEESGWKTWIDWVRLSVSGVRPWVLVHGYLADESAWDRWTHEFAPALSIPTHSFSLADRAGSMWLHGPEIAREIEQVLLDYGVARVDMVGSSKGALDGRVALAGTGPTVRDIVMIGAPHHGSELADIIKIGAILNPVIGAVSQIGEPALTELTTWYSRLATRRIPPNPHVRYSTIAAVWRGGINPLLPGPDGGVVSTASAEALPFAPSLGRVQSFHTELLRNPSVFTLTESQIGSASPVIQEQVTAPQVAFIEQARLAGGESQPSQQWHVVVEAGRPVTFALFWLGGAPTISLFSPSGDRVWGAEIRSLNSAAGFAYQLVHVENPQAGRWRVFVDAGPEETALLLSAAVHSPVRLEAAVTPPGGGQHGTITARMNGSGDSAYPGRLLAYLPYADDRYDAVELNDAGLAGDATAGDGIFSGNFRPPPDFYGDLPVVVVAEAAAEEAPSRYLLTGVTIAHPTARASWGPATRAGGQLVATVLLDGFPEGEYQLFGRVAGSKESGLLTAHAALTLTAPEASVSFRWPHPQAKEDQTLSLEGLYVFDAHGRLIATGPARAIGWQPWSGGPGALRIDRIERPVASGLGVAFPVTLTAPVGDRLVLNGRMTDGKGNHLGWASATGRGPVSAQTWHLRFTGDPAVLLDGPLLLCDLSLYVVGRPDSAVLLLLAYTHGAAVE